MNVTCFGDSNTYGYDPRSFLGGRYDPDHRWVDILAAETGWTVYNMGQNGREIPTSLPFLPSDTNLLILMLGTNDLLQGLSPEMAAAKLERFVQNCAALAPRLSIHFANAGDWNIPLAYDGVHFTQEGHRAFAAGLLNVLSTLPF